MRTTVSPGRARPSVAKLSVHLRRSYALTLNCVLTPMPYGGHPLAEVGEVKTGWAAQAALVGCFFLGFLAGFLTAGWRAAGPNRRSLGRPGERPAGFGVAADDPTAHSRRETELRTR
jgi:hypothetical protein